MKSRILTALVLLAIFIVAMFGLPNFWWSVTLIIPFLIATHEWARLSGYNRRDEALFIALLLSACVLWLLPERSAGLTSASKEIAERSTYLFNVLFFCVVAPFWMWRKLVVRNRLISGLAGFIVLVPTWLALSRLQNSAELLLILLAVIWIADSAAYFTGRSIGKRKLAATISPGKTWEGVAGAFVAVIVYALALYVSGLSIFALPLLIAAFIAMTALGIVGDLFESWVKRSAGVKDSGSILPGHGGMLDRIDAVAAALPAAALIFI